MKVLVLNCGSSSLKYQLIDTGDFTVLAKGICERIGIDGILKHTVANRDPMKIDVLLENHAQAIEAVMEQLLNGSPAVIKELAEIIAVGHRVAHGGSYFTKSTLVDEQVLVAIEDCVPLAPLHNPAALMGIKACMQVMGAGIKQVVVFDTSFHQTMQASAYTYAIPYELAQKHRIRRYGFHGTSHKYVAQIAANMLQKPFEECKIITCHLGNGSSITAVNKGKSVDTSMGFTPLEGLTMGTRSGLIDPAILPFLMKAEGYSAVDIDNLINKQSGLLGISGINSDLREVSEAAENGNERAGIAVSALCYQIKKYIGAYIAAMNGVDAIVFTAGIGENSALVRERALSELDWLGIILDTDKNHAMNRELADISKFESKIKVYIIPTNEELVIAKDTLDLIGESIA